MDGFVIGLDIGTTTVKSVVIGADGRVAAAADEAVAMNTAADGAATQSAALVADAAQRVLQRSVGALGGRGVVRAVGVSAAMHTMLPVDAAGEPMCDATTWGDTRARSAEQAVRDAVDLRALYEETGCPARWLYWPVRMRWWAEHRPGLYRDASRWVSIKEFVTQRLTKRWAIDVGTASATGLLSVHTGEWSAAALRAAALHEPHAAKLSDLVDGDEVIGAVSALAARATGLREGTPIVAGSSDGALANVGAVGLGNTQSVITIGTSGAVRVMLPAPAFDAQARTWCYAVMRLRNRTQSPASQNAGERSWLAGGAINNGGVAAAWLCDRLYANEGKNAWAVMMHEAASVPAGAQGVLCRPHFTGERSPWWNPSMTAAFTGLSLRHSRAHLARAVLEAVAMSIAEVWDCMGGSTRLGNHARLTGGVTRSPLWCAILADVLGITLTASDSGDASALGAAMLAAIGSNFTSYQTVNMWVQSNPQAVVHYQPHGEVHRVYHGQRARWRAVESTSR